jgi:tryptophan 2,3-dioxygenase
MEVIDRADGECAMVYGRSSAATAEPKASYGKGLTPYADYVALDQLHSLQRPRTEVGAEMSFIVTTQVMELLFGLLLHEWTQAQRALREDDLDGAMDAFRRGVHVQDVLNSSWDLLATMTPMEFSAFRDSLGEASGVQSAAYRRLEFLLGNKSARMIQPHRDAPADHESLLAALHGPSIYDDVLSFLGRQGLPVPAEVLSRDLTLPYEASTEVEKAWRAVYESRPEFLRLAELLLDVAERVTRWRQRHYASVRRTMGAKPGTGGSSGLTWLRKAVDNDVFPELWSVRNEL